MAKKSFPRVNIFVALPVIFLAVFALLAYGGARLQNRGNDEKTGTLIIAIKNDPTTLNPVLASDFIPMYVNSFIFSPLVHYDEKMQISPCLAESWRIEEGGRKITFHLRKGVKWHDGADFTAADCVATFEKVLDPSTNTFNRGLFMVEGKPVKFEAVDKYTLTARLKAPFAPFFNNLTLMGIVPRHIIEKGDINYSGFNRSPVGTGPFRFESWKTSDSITLTANLDYFRGAPRLQRIIFKIIPSPEGNRIALLSGQVDLAGLSDEDIFVLKNKIPSQIKIYEWDDFTYFYLGFDLTNPLFSDKKVRQAINYAVDGKTLTKSVTHGAGKPICGPIPSASWAYYSDVEKYPYDPSRARQILEEAGWKAGPKGIREKNGKKFSFNLSFVGGSQSLESSAIFLQSYLADVGIEAKLQSYDSGALIRSLYPEKFEAVVFDWVEPMDPDIFTEWHSSQMGDSGMNFMSYKNSRVDELLQQARSTISRDKRKELYKKVQILIADDAPYVFLWNARSIMGVNSRVKGLSPPSPLGLTHRPEQIWVEP